MIAAREVALVRRALASWRANPAIELLGDLDAARLPIVSFVVRTPGGGRLHHNFVVALLNDLFGIQSRGGCSCAGPYGHRLLGIGRDHAAALARAAVDGWLGIKPGWTRLSFSFYLSEAAFAYLVAAVHLVASHGARLLPAYRFDPASGRWRHHRAPALPVRLRGAVERAAAGAGGGHARAPEAALGGYLREARAILAAAPPYHGPQGAENPPSAPSSGCAGSSCPAPAWPPAPSAAPAAGRDHWREGADAVTLATAV